MFLSVFLCSCLSLSVCFFPFFSMGRVAWNKWFDLFCWPLAISCSLGVCVCVCEYFGQCFDVLYSLYWPTCRFMFHDRPPMFTMGAGVCKRPINYQLINYTPVICLKHTADFVKTEWSATVLFRNVLGTLLIMAPLIFVVSPDGLWCQINHRRRMMMMMMIFWPGENPWWLKN